MPEAERTRGAREALQYTVLGGFQAEAFAFVLREELSLDQVDELEAVLQNLSVAKCKPKPPARNARLAACRGDRTTLL